MKKELLKTIERNHTSDGEVLDKFRYEASSPPPRITMTSEEKQQLMNNIQDVWDADKVRILRDILSTKYQFEPTPAMVLDTLETSCVKFSWIHDTKQVIDKICYVYGIYLSNVKHLHVLREGSKNNDVKKIQYLYHIMVYLAGSMVSEKQQDHASAENKQKNVD